MGKVIHAYGKITIREGDKFGRWTAIEKSHKVGNNIGIKCICSCPKQTLRVVAVSRLIGGYSKSCGCVRYDGTSQEKLGDKTRTHGLSSTRLYKIWKGMKKRCYNTNKPNYKNYGGRGIEVCPEWKDDFSSFMGWSIENGYSDELSIDRVDNDLGYSPYNCQWITLSANCRKAALENKSKNLGMFSEKAHSRSKDSNRKNNGIKCNLISPDREVREFQSIGETAEYLSKLLNRGYSSVYSQCKQILNRSNNCRSIGGFRIERREV